VGRNTVAINPVVLRNVALDVSPIGVITKHFFDAVGLLATRSERVADKSGFLAMMLSISYIGQELGQIAI
jgi:hypothetical protein